QTGQSETAKRRFQDRLSKDPNNPYVNYVLGVMFRRDGALEQAEVRFRRCAELAPDFMSVYRRLVEIAGERGKLEELLRKSLDTINAGATAGAGVYFTLGCIYQSTQSRREWGKAETYFKTAVQIDSRSLEPQYALFQIYSASDRLNEA